MGSVGDVLPAAAGAARPPRRRGGRDALADPGPGRPAARARDRPADADVPRRRPRGDLRPRHRRLRGARLRRRGRRAASPARALPLGSPRDRRPRRARRRAARARRVDLVGDPRRAAAAGDPGGAAGPDRRRHRQSPPSDRPLGWRLLDAGVRLRAVARRCARRERGPHHLRRPDRPLRARRPSPPPAVPDARRDDPAAARPAADGPGLVGRRDAGRRGLPRHPPAHDLRPAGVGQRRPAVVAGAGPRAGPGGRRDLRPGRARAARRRGPRHDRARHRVPRPLVAGGDLVAGGAARRGPRAGTPDRPRRRGRRRARAGAAAGARPDHQLVGHAP